ncbi:hypothetical protein CA54_31070 [Symmachiella macrocystis]|uniref:Type II secretion system protein n=1 Tax=Symmachiella macrocystis TaxID=2527985 RepID=A0A5C6BU63_9PLAN|nr:hypothetical protein [Symmachiella macrocystis]TWU14264.1 hypothetical protein CA54_31070 [Symmachiella macrocystis]
MNRRTNRPIRSATSPSTLRGGVTLVEVLMSLLVVGVGLVSVAVLFPLSILRTIEATQLTSATMVRYNAEEMIDAFPALAFNPDGDADVAEHANTNYIVDPFGFDVLTTLSGAAVPATGASPVPFGGVPGASGDPGVLERFPGSIATGTIIPDLGPPPNPSRAVNFVTQPDSWDTLLDETSSIPANYLPATPSIEFPGAAAAIGLTADYDGTVLGVPVYRAIFFDATGDRSHTRVLTGITNIANSVLTWNDPLPNGFTPATAWLQAQERHYSWLLTVRRGTPSDHPGPDKQPGVAGVDDNSDTVIDDVGELGWPGSDDLLSENALIEVVVFFNRTPENGDPMSDPPTGADALAESAYPLLAPGFQRGVATVSLDWGTNPEPFLKEGKFIFDPEGARWYRILKITSTGDTSARLDLDRGAETNSVFSEDAAEQGLGVFLPGIVDVYPIARKSAEF